VLLAFLPFQKPLPTNFKEPNGGSSDFSAGQQPPTQCCEIPAGQAVKPSAVQCAPIWVITTTIDRNSNSKQTMSEAGTNADAVAAEKERKFRIQGGFLSSPVRHLHIPLT